MEIIYRIYDVKYETPRHITNKDLKRYLHPVIIECCSQEMIVYCIGYKHCLIFNGIPAPAAKSVKSFHQTVLKKNLRFKNNTKKGKK